MTAQAHAGTTGRGDPAVVAAIGGWPAAFGLAIVVVAVVAAVFAPVLAPSDPQAQNLLARNLPPGPAAWLGTDHLGRDVLSRLLFGARVSLAVGFAGTLAALLLGAGLAGIALAAGRWPLAAFAAAVDLIRALPGVLFALVLVVALGSGIGPVILASGVSFLPMFALVTASTYERERRAGYVRAALVLGAERSRILFVHMLPNILGALVTLSAIVLPRVITLESVLSFLGLGVSPQTPSWGRMIADATRYVEGAPHAVAFPILALVLTTLGMALIGDGLRHRFDPLRRGLVQ